MMKGLTMKNNFTKEDIKNSVEYQWRKTSFCWLLGIWAFIAVAMLLSILAIGFDDIKPGMSLQVWLIPMSIYSVIYLPFVAYYGYKMLYILNHYTEFNSYEVMLDNISTSYAYRGAVYYTVTVNDEGTIRKVRTNPYFSSGTLAKFTLEDYNNKMVIGLYDSQMDKFYIIKKCSTLRKETTI